MEKNSFVVRISLCCVLFYLSSYLDTASSYQHFAKGFCVKTTKLKFHTKCQFCGSNAFTRCPQGSDRLTSGRGRSDCKYGIPMPRHLSVNNRMKILQITGCRHTCQKIVQSSICCPGHWGAGCDECPGGSLQTCNGHGVCNETKLGDGTCVCQEEFRGFACEQCANSTSYGAACNQSCECVHGQCNSGVKGDGSCDCYSGFQGPLCDQSIPSCVNITCDENSRCMAVNGTGDCVCDVGYESTSESDGKCTPIDLCRTSPCGPNASCQFNGANMFNCTCDVGYHGDGLVCDPIDPCQTNFGECPQNSSVCVYDGPGKSHCQCLEGYETFVSDLGCELIDMCVNMLKLCDVNARCSTIAPGQALCVCNPGYGGNGTNCYGNIVNRIEELNRGDELQGQLSQAQLLIETLYQEELSASGPFTIFIPNNKGFRSEMNAQAFGKFLSNEDEARQILRQHIIIGELSLDQLYNSTTFYTLQGIAAELQARNNGDTFRYRLHGSGNKGKIILGDQLATNGVIHVINSLMTNVPEARGDTGKTVLEIIQSEGRYNRLQTLVVVAGLEELFNGDNITVFTPLNSAWNSLPEGTLDYLQTQALDKLQLLLKHHIFPGRIEVTDLITRVRIQSMANTSVEVLITDVGQIRLDRKVNVSQTDIPASNGLYYHVESVLLPGNLQRILPNRCDVISSQVVKGECGPCTGELTCPGKTDQPLNEITRSCHFWLKQRFGYPRFLGCARMCNRTYHTRKCCEGFYGNECLPCPGGFQNQCHGNGKCDEGFYGKGGCQCNGNFTGVACELCSEGLFGVNCSQKCTCEFGVCDDGPKGTGHCKSCFHGYRGEDCHQFSTPCDRKYCHAHGMCILNKTTHEFSCVCSPGYEGDGDLCKEIDPCQDNRGGCHAQAMCVKTGPGQRECLCDDGWLGDGFYCSAATYCTFHRDCHEKAVCRFISSGKYACVCMNDFHGNGSYCVPSNPCTENNGGCRGLAQCVYTGPGNSNCTCPEGYLANGKTCYSTLDMEIENHPNLTQVARLLKILPEKDNILQSNESYTIFAPNDAAMTEFLSKTKALYWQKYENILTMMSFHMMGGNFNSDMLKVRSQNYNKFPTLADGYSLHIVINTNGFFVTPRSDDSSLMAQVLSADIVAINGFIHIIDKVLEPFLPDTSYPDLRTFFSTVPDYSIFAQWLEDKGLLEEIEDMQAYTLFVPTNMALQGFNKTLTKSFLKYYILPELRLTISMDNSETVSTVLGGRHQLQFTVQGRRISVNDAEILEADHLTYGGIVHSINGILAPILHICDTPVVTSIWGNCTFCGSAVSDRCPPGFSPTPENIWSSKNCYLSRMLGCMFRCERREMVRRCCAGYYGESCDECPGGPEMPCNNNGLCDDGRNGTGRCVCQPQFTGEACQECEKGRFGPECSKRTDSCGYRNGGCSPNAICEEISHAITCRCKPGYRGNGFKCDSPCDHNNGGCHTFATCHVQKDDLSHVICRCMFGYHGDGKICKETKNLCNIKNGNCSANATCLFTPPPDTESGDGLVHCKCRPGFKGNGSMCNADVLDTLHKVKQMRRFIKMLSQGLIVGRERDEILSTLKNKSLVLTVFVPVSESLDNKLMTKEDFETHIVNQTYIHLGYPLLPGTPRNVSSMSGRQLLLTADNKSGHVFVNGIEVVEANIPCYNGLIHLIQSPLCAVTAHLAENQAEFNISVVVAPLVVVVLLVFIAVGAMYVYRRSQESGFLNISKKFRRGSDSNSAFASLNQHQEDEDVLSQSPDIDNPLYNVDTAFEGFHLLNSE